MSSWINYVVTSKFARNTEGHLQASDLRKVTENHDGREAYHCAFDAIKDYLKSEKDTGKKDKDGKPVYEYLLPQVKGLPITFTEYEGPARPAYGYVWFDFDSDNIETSLKDTVDFIDYLGKPPHLFTCFSGSKGFHVGVPFSYFGLEISEKLPEKLRIFAKSLKTRFKSIDTTVYNANRKFRLLGSQHPKTKLYKCYLGPEVPHDLSKILDIAKARGVLEIPNPPILPALNVLVEAFKNTDVENTLSFEEYRRYTLTDGTEAFKQCGFLKHCKTAPDLSEPERYAMASIVGRFENGRAQFHEIYSKHPGYSKQKGDDKLAHALAASGPRTCRGVAQLYSKCVECPLFEKISSPIAIRNKDFIKTEATGFYFVNEDTGNLTPDYEGIFKAFTRENPYVVDAEAKTPYVFATTHYVETNPILLKNFAETTFNPAPMERVRTEFMAKIFANFPKRKEWFFKSSEGKLNFLNGILDLPSGAMLKHSPEFGFRNVLPYEFDPQADCPNFKKFLNEIMLGDTELIAILQEFMGYVLRGGEYEYHKALWLHGTGRNGKSTFIHVLKALIGDDNYSVLSIRQIINDRFAAAQLDGKIANFSEETSPEELSDSGPFKNLTGDGEVEAQRKFGQPFRFRNRAKMIMTYNEIPLLKDLSVGMQSRPIIVPFKANFSAKGVQDPKLKEKLFKELPGIFNYAWEGWLRLDANQGFTESQKSVAAMEEIREESDKAFQWFREFVAFTGRDTDFVSSQSCYEHFQAVFEDRYPLSEQKFYRRLGGIPQMDAAFDRPYVGGKKTRGYRGIKLLDKNSRNETDF